MIFPQPVMRLKPLIFDTAELDKALQENRKLRTGASSGEGSRA